MFPAIENPVRQVFVERGVPPPPSLSLKEAEQAMAGLLKIDSLEAPFAVPALDSLLAYIQDLRSLENTIPGFFLKYGGLSRAEALAELDGIVERDRNELSISALSIPAAIAVIASPVVFLALLLVLKLHLSYLIRTLPERVPNRSTAAWPVLSPGLPGGLFLWAGILAWPAGSSIFLFLRQVSTGSLGGSRLLAFVSGLLNLALISLCIAAARDAFMLRREVMSERP